jgi:hypothetical protein
MEEASGVQFPASNTSQQEPVSELQGSATQQVGDPTQKLESVPEDMPVAPVTASCVLKGSDGNDTDKLDAISQSPLVEKKDTSSAPCVQFKANAEDCEQNSPAVKKPSASVELPPKVVGKVEGIPAQAPENDQKYENFSDIITKLNIIKKTVKHMRVTLEQVFPGYIAELLEEHLTDEEAEYIEKEMAATRISAADILAEEEENICIDKEVATKMKTLRATFNKMVSSYGKEDSYKLEKELELEDSKNVEITKTNSQLVKDTKGVDDANISPSADTSANDEPQ